MKSLSRNWLALLGFLQLLSIESAYADNDPMVNRNIWIGPSVIDCCKCICLCMADKTKGSSQAQPFITSKSKKFLSVKAWVMENLYHSLNDSINGIDKTDSDTLILSTFERQGLEDILVSIHLNEQTLGSDYKNKIAELKMMLEARSESTIVEPKEQLKKTDSMKL